MNHTARSLVARTVTWGVGRRSVHVEGRIHSLGLAMPPHNVPKNAFVNYVKVGNTVYLSGHLPQPAEGELVVGKIGKDLKMEEGYEAAKLCGLNLCATLKANLGDLDKVKRIVKLTAFVNCTDSFTQQPAVVNGCSELFMKVFGPTVGEHSRSAVGTNSLPLGVAVEIEAVVEVE